ncbi:MAG: hypothetical protein P8M04_06380 [Akkermansiaceae bacterium]|jgi:hypothetical protein|nr:hypothetical protein [Akkermansiaceae bacterium]
MGLFSFLNTDRQNFDVSAADSRLSVDLTKFIIGSTPLGKEPWDGDSFAKYLEKETTLKSDQYGYELGIKNGKLNHAFFTLKIFKGIFLVEDKSLLLSNTTNRKEIITIFGEPYWTDIDDSEIILFYEYQEGTTELQFEFPDGEHLEFITLIKGGILSKQAQRESYGVTKPWPPEKRQ